MRRKRIVESFRSAAEAIGTVEAGMSLFAVTRGQWSMIDAIFHCLSQTGPANISVRRRPTSPSTGSLSNTPAPGTQSKTPTW